MSSVSLQSSYPLKLYLKYRANGSLIGVATAFNLATWFWVGRHIRPVPELLFLHYNILFGVDYIGEWWRVFGLPTIGLIILALNFLLGWFLFRHDKLISLLVNATSILCQVFLLIAAVLLVSLNT